MLDIILGTVGVAATVALLRLSLPSRGKPRWFVGTELEPYIAVALTGAAVMSIGFIVKSVVGMLLE